MTKACFIKKNGSLFPVDDDGRALLDSLSSTKEVVADVKQARNPRFHRLFFGVLKLLVDNSEQFDNVEQALTAVKIAIGEVDPVVDSKTGKTFWTLRSISFESCDNVRFTRLFERALHTICDRWLVGTDREELRQQVYALVDGDARASLGRRAA
jgi:Protein of unknown function (DUF1367)